MVVDGDQGISSCAIDLVHPDFWSQHQRGQVWKQFQCIHRPFQVFPRESFTCMFAFHIQWHRGSPEDSSQIKHDHVIKWKHFPRYWPFVREIHRSPVNSQHKGQWRGALMFSLMCALNKRLSKQSWGWWFETPSRSLWRQGNVYILISDFIIVVADWRRSPVKPYWEWVAHYLIFKYMRTFKMFSNWRQTNLCREIGVWCLTKRHGNNNLHAYMMCMYQTRTSS